MNKTELINAVAENLDFKQAAAKAAVDEVFNLLTFHLTKKGSGTITIKDFGTFQAIERKARKARNPHTGETIKVAAKMVPHFKPATALKDSTAGVKPKK